MKITEKFTPAAGYPREPEFHQHLGNFRKWTYGAPIFESILSQALSLHKASPDIDAIDRESNLLRDFLSTQAGREPRVQATLIRLMAAYYGVTEQAQLSSRLEEDICFGDALATVCVLIPNRGESGAADNQESLCLDAHM